MSDEPSKSVLLSSSGTSVTASENTVTSKRQGRAYFTQAENSGNSAPVELIQEEAVTRYGYNVYLAYGNLVEADQIELIWLKYETFPKHVRIEAYRDTYMNGRITDTINIDWRYDKNEGHFGHYSVSKNASGLEFSPIEQNDTGEFLIETFRITAVGAFYPQAAITCHHKHY